MKKLLALGFLVIGSCTISESENVGVVPQPEGEKIVYQQTNELCIENGDFYAKIEIRLAEGKKFLRFQLQEGQFVFWGQELKSYESPATYELTEENIDLLRGNSLLISGEKDGIPLTKIPVKKIRIIEKREVETKTIKKTTYG